MSAWLIALAVVAYLVFGFCLGIAREWAAQAVPYEKGAELQWLAAFFFFPIFSLVDNSPDDKNYQELFDGAFILKITKGGFGYWDIIALVWPITMVWSLIGIAIALICMACHLFVSLLGLPGKLCRQCEVGIKRACGIKT